MEKNVETELKLLFGKRELKALLELPLVTKKTIKGSHQSLKLVNAYYDTRDLILRQAGIAYRIRQTGKAFEQTVKMSKRAAGGLTSRGEYTVSAKGWHPAPDKFNGSGLPLDLEGLLGGAMLEKLFSVRVRREVRLLQVTKETVVEMAIDEGHVLAGKKKDTINEVELELKEGRLGDLLEFTAQIAQRIPFFTESRSKYVRGLNLLGKMDPAAQAWTSFEPEGKSSYAGAVKGQIYQYGTRILEEQNAFRESHIEEEADRIFLPSFRTILRTLFWVRTLFDRAHGLVMNLRTVTEPLEKLHTLKEFRATWRKLYKSAGPLAGSDKLTDLVEKDIARTADKIRGQVRDGVYTAVLFSVYAALEQGSWNAGDYLQLDQMLQLSAERTLEEIHHRLVEQSRKEAPAAAAGKKGKERRSKARRQDGGACEEEKLLARFLEQAAPLMGHLGDIAGRVKIEALTKDGRKKLARLAESLEGSMARARLLQYAAAQLGQVRDAVTACEAGLLCGWLLAASQAERRKQVKYFRKWAAEVRLPEKADNMPPRPVPEKA